MTNKVSLFWSAFMAIEKDLQAQGTKTISSWLHAYLPRIDPRIMWQVNQNGNLSYHIAFTCEQNYGVRPLIEELVDAAPLLQNWTFSTTKLPVKIEDLSEVYKTRSLRDLPNFSYSLSASPTNFVDFEICDLDGKNSYDEWDIYLPLELVLGEDLFEVWGGHIDYTSAPFTNNSKDNFSKLRLCDLPVKFKELVQAILAETTPQAPYWQSGFSEPTDTVTNDPLFDRKRFETLAPRITEATFHHRFWSRRFSRFKEEFCFLELKLSELIQTETELVQVKKLVDSELKRKMLGCSFASGMSKSFCYVDLVLTDVNESVIALKDLLKDHAYARLGFYDQAYSAGSISLT